MSPIFIVTSLPVICNMKLAHLHPLICEYSVLHVVTEKDLFAVFSFFIIIIFICTLLLMEDRCGGWAREMMMCIQEGCV